LYGKWYLAIGHEAKGNPAKRYLTEPLIGRFNAEALNP
jgi:hypothetical protein